MALPSQTAADLHRNTLKESTSTSGQTGVVVINPDGSNLGSSGLAGSFKLEDKTTSSQKAAVDASGQVSTSNGLLTASDIVTALGGVTSVSTQTYSRDTSSALEASSISKASAGNLYRAFGVIDATAATDIYYVQFLDSATLTGDGAVTHLITPIPVNHITGTDSSFDTGHFDAGVAAANGIVIVLSTTLVTKTIVTGGNVALFATVLYK